MTVYVDVSAAVHRRAGLGRYASNLSEALFAAVPRNIALFHNRERSWQPLHWAEKTDVPTRSIRMGYKPWRMLVWLSHHAGIRFNRLLPGATLYHATEHLLMPLRDIPTVLTVHDLIYSLFPEHHKKLNYWYLNLTMPLYCRRANHIIAVSDSSKEDLGRRYGVPSSKVTVIYEAADQRFRPVSQQEADAVRSKYSLPDRYTMFVGTIEPRKNIVRLLDALEKLNQMGRGIPLILVGSSGWLIQPILERIESMPSGTVTRLGYVPDADLPAVYAAADFSVQPSLYEGFGLPVLESMACGTPVACSTSSSLPEVGGDAALYFDPEDVDEMAAVIDRLVSNEDLRRELAQASLEQSKRFSWTRTAQETISVYQQVQSEFGTSS